MKGFLSGVVFGFVVIVQPTTVAADGAVSKLGLRLLTPSAGAVLSGEVFFVAVADGTGLASLQFFVDEKPLGAPIVSGACRASWDSLRVADGPHVLEARGLDGAKAAVVSAPVTVTVKNAFVPLPAPPIPQAAPAPSSSAAPAAAPAQPVRVPATGAILKPEAGSTVRGDFTVAAEASALPFRVELAKPDGTVVLTLVRKTAEPFPLTGAKALPSGRYTLMLKTRANQNPPAASVAITLDNKGK
jgi:hypothetical protein